MVPPDKRHHRRLPHGLVILHEDRDILVVDKPAGLLSISTDKESERTAYYILTDYVRKGNYKSPHRVFIVHRLDRETSGVLLLAKTEAVKRKLQSHWDETEKKYLAVAHGRMEKKTDTIETHLAENKALVVYSTDDPEDGKLSKTHYKVLRQKNAVALLAVDLLTGRKNQIRVHLSGIGHPIVGDKKYGKPGDTGTRLALHAWKITLNHPFNGKPMTFTAPIPAHFEHLVGAIFPPVQPPPAPAPVEPSPPTDPGKTHRDSRDENVDKEPM